MTLYQFDMFMDEIEEIERLKSGEKGKKGKEKITTEEIIAMAKKRGIKPPKD